jgi:hypothetical protein
LRVTIESTDKVVDVMTESGFTVPGRIWEGRTDSGIVVQCLVTRIVPLTRENLEQFERELTECRPPQVLNVFPLRMVL